MKERRSGLLLVGSEKQSSHFFGYEQHFTREGIEVTHRDNVSKHLTSEEQVELEYYRTGDRPRDEGERLLRHHLGNVARRAAGILIVNEMPDGDVKLRPHDITGNEWDMLNAFDGPRDARFIVNPLPSSSVYKSFTAAPNGLSRDTVIGGQLQVVVNKIYQVEGRKRK
jgi:hypothetical protein